MYTSIRRFFTWEHRNTNHHAHMRGEQVRAQETFNARLRGHGATTNNRLSHFSH